MPPKIETVVIKIVGDPKDINKTIAALEKVGKVDRQNAESFKKTSKTFDGLKTKALALGTAMLGAFAIQQVVTNAITSLKEFEKELSTLQSITGLTAKEMEFFAKEAVNIGRATKTAASEVVRAFTQIGSAQPELLKNSEALAEVTKQALILGKAAGIDATQAAQSLTGAMNQFGAEAKDAAKFTDILATSQQKGSSFIADTTEALVNAGAAASAAGLSFETTNAAIQALAKGNIKGARAGTALRGVLSKLSSQTDNSINPSMIGLSKTLEVLRGRNLSLADATKLVGEEGATGLLTLIKQIELFDKLDGSLNETGNALEQMRINTKNLTGAWDELGDTIEEVTLQAGQSTGVMTKFINALSSSLQIFSGTGDEIDKITSVLSLQKGELGLLRREYGTWAGALTFLQGTLNKLGFEVRDFGVTIKPNIEDIISVSDAIEKWRENLKKISGETEASTQNEKERALTINELKQKIDTLRKAQGDLLIGSNELLDNRKELKTLEIQLAKALGKTIKKEKERKLTVEELISVETVLVRILLGKQTTLEEIARIQDINAQKELKGVKISETAADRTRAELDRENELAAKRKGNIEGAIASSQKFFSILSQMTENRLIEVDNQFKTESDKLQANLDNNIISEEEFTKQRIILQKRFDLERAEILRKQAINDKAAAVIEATINTAVAVTSALKVSRILAVLTAALGAAEIAVIASQPIPKFHKGKKSEKSIGEIDAKILRSETVVPPKPSQKFKKELDAMIDGKYEKYAFIKYQLPLLKSQMDKNKFISERDFYDKKFQKRLINLTIENNRLLQAQRQRQGFW